MKGSHPILARYVW